MKKSLLLLFLLVSLCKGHSQIEPAAGTWRTWFITSGKEHRLPPPPNAASTQKEGKMVEALQSGRDSALQQKIVYWSVGAPSFRWRSILPTIYSSDTSQPGMLVSLLFNIAVYDATVAAWDTKYIYNRPRPFAQNKNIKAYIVKPESPSYPCENSVAAGVAVALASHFYPQKSDSITKLAEEAMQARVAAGVQYESDTKAGFELGKKVAEIAIAKTAGFVPSAKWDGKMPGESGMWKGSNPFSPLQGTWKTLVLTSGSQFRPPPPPDYKKEMEELRAFKPSYRSMANAFFWSAQNSYWFDLTEHKILEYNIHLNPPRAARIYAFRSAASYDGFIACYDAKYAYWGTRPNQYDTSYHPVLMHTPNFPGYPSAHAVMAATSAAVLSYFFPTERDFFLQKAKEAAESRFEGGVHFRSDNEVGLELGKQVAELVLQRARNDGADAKQSLVKH